jgi:hypothetical protein
MTFDEKVREYCPMEDTEYEGFCIDNHATIKVKTAKCSHRDYCENLKKELEEAK